MVDNTKTTPEEALASKPVQLCRSNSTETDILHMAACKVA